jgi:two-component system, chemotaxis family, sensor kinase CheA
MPEIDRSALLESFRTESEEGLAEMEQALLALESRPGDKDAFFVVLRAVHTLKGSSGCLGFKVLPQFAHELEDALQRTREGAADQQTISALLGSVDVLRSLAREAGADRDVAVAGQNDVLARLGSVAAPVRHEAEGAAGTSSTAEREGARTLRVSLETLDRLLTLTGEITIARGRLTRVLEAGSAWGGEALETHREADRLHIELQEQVMKARMVRVGPILRPLVRTVRDLALAHGKQAQLGIHGEDVEVDTKVVQALRDPLVHMIRNALDHGIEPPDVRQTAGKDPCGMLVLGARQEGGSVVVQLSDDGAGLDRGRIVARARALGLLGEGDEPGDEELHRLLFRPGFSTAEAVTDLSGRGVGMDVVRREVDALRGTITIASRPGRGTTVAIRVPLTLAIIEGFEVAAAGESYILPMDTVVECLELPPEHAGSEATGVMNLRGQPTPFARLRRLFALEGERTRRENLVVLQHGTGRVGLAVDALLGERQAVVKPLGRPLRGVSGVSGSTILGDGRVALILDVPALVQMAVDGHGSPPAGGAAAAEARA